MEAEIEDVYYGSHRRYAPLILFFFTVDFFVRVHFFLFFIGCISSCNLILRLIPT